MKKLGRRALEGLRGELEKNLSRARYQHTLGVACTAACLAMRYGADPESAEIAGLLHDCAKEYREKELLFLGREFGLRFSEAEEKAPQILHAIVGPCIARQKYGLDDSEILSAIRWHTTGRAGMSLLEQIVFVADYIEPNRDKDEDLPEIRALAFQDLQECVYRISENTLKYLKKSGAPADPMTEQCFLWFREHRSSGGRSERGGQAAEKEEKEK